MKSQTALLLIFFDLLPSKRWHTYMFSIGLFAETTMKLIYNSCIRSLGVGSWDWKELESVVWHLKAICSLQQFETPFNACCNFVLICNNINLICTNITPTYGMTTSKGFSFTIPKFSLTRWMLSRNLSIKFSGQPLLRNILFKEVNYVWNFIQLEKIRKHL